MRPEIMFMQCFHLVHFLSEVALTHRQEGQWNSGRNLFLSLTKVYGSATSSAFEVQRIWSHPSGQLNHFVADILWRSLLLRSDNVRCMVVNGNLGSRLIGVVGQALRFSGELPVAGTRQDGNAQRCGRELPSAETFSREPVQHDAHLHNFPIDRSSLAQEPARLPAAKLPSMFGGAPGQLLGFSAWEPPAVQPWMVQDPAINHWLDAMSDSTKRNLEGCPAELRSKVTASVYTRSLTNTLQNPEAYLNGAIFREMREGQGKMVVAPSQGHQASPYSGGPPRSQPTCGYVQAPALGRPPASAHQQCARVPRPPWVEEAWALRSSERQFFRFLARVLPHNTLDKIADLPGQLQHQVLVAMLLLDATAQPVAFLENCVERFKTFPVQVPTAMSSSPSESSEESRRKLLILSFGISTGLEWAAVDVAIQLAKDNFSQQFDVIQRCAFVAQHFAKEVFEEICVHMVGPSIELVPLEEASNYVRSNCAGWKARGCTLLALVHVPKAERSAVPVCSAAPGYHGSASSNIWMSFNALSKVQTFIPEMCIATFQPHCSSKADTDYFDTTFGKAMEVDSLRLPTEPWSLRCQPPGTNAKVTTRPFHAALGNIRVEDFHPNLQGAFSGDGAPPAKLPSLAALEIFLDADPNTAEARDGREAAALIMRQPCSGDHPVLLSREHLASLFGVRDFKWIEHWTARMPCSKYINTITGQPTLPGRPECVVCGHGRWCPNCGYFYEALTECVNPHLVTKGVLTLLQVLCGPREDTALFSTRRLPDHICSGHCTGFAVQP